MNKQIVHIGRRYLTLGCCKCHVVLGLAGHLPVQSQRMKMSGIKLKLTGARDIKIATETW